VRYQAVEVTRRALIRELVRRFAAENAAEADIQATAEELKKRVGFAHGVLNAGKDTDFLDWLEEELRPILQRGVTPDQAAELAALLRPHLGIRVGDKLALFSKRLEPFGWDLQNGYALALAQKGDFESARKESDLLLKKVKIVMSETRIPPSQKILESQRRIVMTRSLVEALAGARLVAQTYYDQAKDMEVPGDPPGDDVLRQRLEKVIGNPPPK
jgi:hypothetical protein